MSLKTTNRDSWINQWLCRIHLALGRIPSHLFFINHHSYHSLLILNVYVQTNIHKTITQAINSQSHNLSAKSGHETNHGNPADFPPPKRSFPKKDVKQIHTTCCGHLNQHFMLQHIFIHDIGHTRTNNRLVDSILLIRCIMWYIYTKCRKGEYYKRIPEITDQISKFHMLVSLV